MRQSVCPSVFLATLLSAFGVGSGGIDEGELVERGRIATALLLRQQAGSRVSGPAFCVGSEGFFLAAHRVVKELDGAEKLELVLRPGEADGEKFEADILRADAARDLVLLKVKGVPPEKLVDLPIAEEGALYETLPVWVFGFRTGEGDETEHVQPPSMGVTATRVHFLEKQEGALKRFRLTESIDSGWAGGPILNAEAQVVGMVMSGAYGSRVKSGVPLNRIREFLQEPMVRFEPPDLAAESMYQPVRFEATARRLMPPRQTYDIRLVLAYMGHTRTVTLRPKESAYVAQTVVCPKHLGDTLRVTVEFSSATISGKCRDQAVTVGGKSIKLSSIREIVKTSEMEVRLRSGAVLRGEIQGLDEIPLVFGQAERAVPLSKARKVAFAPIPLETAVAYRLEVRDGESVIRAEEGHIGIAGLERVALPAVPSAASSGTGSTSGPMDIRKAPVEDLEEMDLPGKIENLGVGGGGRFLVFYFRRLGKLGVFDANAARIVRYIPASTLNAEFAVGRSKLILVPSNMGTIERWDLLTGQKELTFPCPFDPVAGMAMGSETDERFLICGMLRTPNHRRRHISFWGVRTFRPTDIPIEGSFVDDYSRSGANVRASADGTVYAAGNLHAAEGLGAMVLAAGRARVKRLHLRSWLAVPSPDGRFIHAHRKIYTSTLAPFPVVPKDAELLVPAVRGRYILGVTHVRTREGPTRKTRVRLGLYVLGHADPVVRLDAIDLGGAATDSFGPHQTPDKFFYLIPDADLLVIVTPSKDRLILKNLNIDDLLRACPGDHLFVASCPPGTATRGRLLVYRIAAKSTRGEISYNLKSGPPGMRVDARGRLTWQVPAHFDAGRASGVILIEDCAGQRVYHAFVLAVK